MTAKELHNKIGNYYCVVETDKEAQALADACKEVAPKLDQMNIKVFGRYRYFVILKGETGGSYHSFVSWSGDVKEKEKITQNEMMQKITNQETYNLEVTGQDVFFLRCLLGGCRPDEAERLTGRAAKETEFLRKAIYQNFSKVHMGILYKTEKLVNKNNITDEIFKEEKTETFSFLNGQTATWTNGQNKIQIGCQTKTRQEILAYEDIFDKVDEIKVGGLTFKAAEGKDFIKYLRDH